MERQLKVGFLGYGTRALDALMQDKRFDVTYFLAPKARLCQDVFDAYARYGDRLRYGEVKNNRELARYFEEIEDVDCFIMNACPIILNQEVLSRMEVFNIHPGNIQKNRGHHPHLWTVLLGETSSEIVMHKVDLKIDNGAVLKSVPVDISPEDSAEDVLNKLEDQIPKLLDALYICRTTGVLVPEKVIQDGTYRRAVTYKDYEIQVQTDDLIQIKRKILARSMHHGAFIPEQGMRYYVDQIEEVCCQENKERRAEICPQSHTVILFTEKEKIRLHLGKIEPAK